jgi:hypothetical protein
MLSKWGRPEMWVEPVREASASAFFPAANKKIAIRVSGTERRASSTKPNWNILLHINCWAWKRTLFNNGEEGKKQAARPSLGDLPGK